MIQWLRQNFDVNERKNYSASLSFDEFALLQKLRIPNVCGQKLVPSNHHRDVIIRPKRNFYKTSCSYFRSFVALLMTWFWQNCLSSCDVSSSTINNGVHKTMKSHSLVLRNASMTYFSCCSLSMNTHPLVSDPHHHQQDVF